MLLRNFPLKEPIKSHKKVKMTVNIRQFKLVVGLFLQFQEEDKNITLRIDDNVRLID